MSLIDREAAIKAIENCTGIYVNNLPTMINKTDAYKVLTDLPSAQPDVPDTNVGDMISRQAAIDAMDEALTRVFVEHRDIAEKVINKISPAQPEIVRCKDCKHRDPEDKKCDSGHFIQWQLPRDDDWFCADAERRTDDSISD